MSKPASESHQGGDYAKAIPLLPGVVSRDDKDAGAYNWLAYAACPLPGHGTSCRSM